MEKKLKTTSHDDEVDRISELPEHIIHHIMEFLPSTTQTADVTRMSALSKKFFSFWCSFPVLDFNAKTILNKSKVRDTESVLNSIQYTFQHRRLNIKTCLQSLKFFGYGAVNNDNTIRDVIHEMINFAIQRQVKQLHVFTENKYVRITNVGQLPYHRNQMLKLSCFPEPVFSTESITVLSLDGFNFEAQHHLTLSCPLVEDFFLRRCSGIKSIILLGEKLRCVDFMDCYELEKIQVDGPTSLDVLRYGGSNYCDINLASNKSVKLLKIQGTHNIHDKWFDSNFCRFVENLEFYRCNFPVKTRWYFDNLKRLHLDSCHCEVEFETPNLEWFYYRGHADWGIPLLISSRRFDAKLQAYNFDVLRFEEFPIPRSYDFARFITQCQTLTLLCYYVGSLIYPRAMRARLNRQLHDMKHLKIECIFPKKENNIVELIDSLLWLAPHPNTISFIDYKSQAVLRSIKFNYHDTTFKNANCCGSFYDVECWPRHLKEVELHKFEDVDERTSLQTYFFSTYKISTVINE